MNKISRGWRIFKNSMVVLKHHKKLMLFPIISLMIVLGIIMFFMLSVTSFKIEDHSEKGIKKTEIDCLVYKYKSEMVTDKNGKKSWNKKISSPLLIKLFPKYSPDKFRNGTSDRQNSFIAIIIILVIYLGLMFFATFFNVVFYSEIIQALNGNEVSIIRGFKLAWSKKLQILFWSLFAGIIGYIIKILEEQFGLIGRIIMNLIGVTWSVASVFAVPIIIREQNNINPIDYLKKSALTIKNTWGEGLIGYIGFGWISLSFVLATVLILGVPLFIFIFNSMITGCLIIGGIWVIALLAYFYIINVMERIYLCSLYVYASEGVIPEVFDKEILDTAWKVKKETQI